MSDLVKLIEYPPITAGVDEVGRGCLAGPVYAAAVVFKDWPSQQQYFDSKTLSEKRRETLAKQIWAQHWVGIGSASVNEIDEINILQASLLAMRRALLDLEDVSGLNLEWVLVDGNQKIPDIPWQQTTIISGDSRCEVISAASIVAKVVRDQKMRELAFEYPEFDFQKNKGYGSQDHRDAISKFGPTPIHRKTFGGVREYLHLSQNWLDR